jgi:hypothetical protein
MDEKLVENEISEMNKAFVDEVKQPEEKPQELEVKESGEKKEEAPIEVPVEKQEILIPKEEIKETPEPPKEAPKEESPVDPRDKVIEELRKQIEDLAGKPKEEPKEEKPKETPEKPEKKDEPIVLETQDYLKGLDLDDLTREPEKFNQFLNTFRAQIVTDTRKVLAEGILKSIPDIVNNNIAINTHIREVKDKFYSDNPDLKPFSKIVAAIAENVMSKNQGKSYEDLLEPIANEVRSTLKLQKVAKGDPNNKPEIPELPVKGGRAGNVRDTKPNTKGIQDELEAMEKALEI